MPGERGIGGIVYLAYDYPLLNVFWTMFWFFLWILWFILLFRIITDIFRDKDMSGWGKAGWLAFVILLPFVGVLVYVIARGKHMGRREMAQARDQQREFDAYIRETASGAARPSSAEELTRLSELRSRGDITDEEFNRAKALVLTDEKPAASPAPGVPPTPGR
ncbi:SHOCT domain-containing protein [Streptomyces sp. NBC_00233]|uniref:SHOCT domain-containing protein n=1 Tax=Streptomyces sp. NBC_00233 TaxID=2975686 RepID=UPI002252E52E|nr:SHOCT domain-containing protein [Streptomyces sp. NBC_00233]MCX5232360.1 PLDc N-terminal domain-containing protein [Streptomyces sp. NBC_00233]